MAHPAIMNTYGQPDLGFVSGEGVWLTDDNGQRYMDAISGIGVCNLGHCHPAVTETIQRQAATLLHTSNLYRIGPQQELADALRKISGMDNMFFANSGAEANEAAIKIARLYGHQQGIEQPAIIVFDHAFHGRTLATLTATGNPKIQAGFEPLVAGFIRAPYNDIAALQTIAANNTNVVAILAEPIQGEGGVNIPEPGYLRQLRELCDNHNWLLMLDEVQTGNGRTGRYFAYQHEDILPDVVTTAKGLGNGVPIGACLASGKAAQVFGPGNHGSTYGGNPLVCATALTVVNTIESLQLTEQATARGQLLQTLFEQALSGDSRVVEIRHKGLMMGITLNQDCPQLVEQARQKGILINVTAGNVIRLLPPLVITEEECEFLVNNLSELVKQLPATA